MTQTFSGKLRGVISRWLRTGTTPSVQAYDEIELRFDLWPDPEGGRFVPRYLIDRKLTIVDARKARDQVLRQSKALAQRSFLGMWEVPSDVQKERALKLIERMNVTNIKVRVVKP